MRKKKVLLICTLLVSVMYATAQLSQHGIIVSGGIGSVDAKSKYQSSQQPKTSWDYVEFDYKMGLSAGYRLRFKMPTPQSFHFDTDAKVGGKFINDSQGTYETRYGEDGSPVGISGGGVSSTVMYNFSAINFTANYSIVKNLSVGLGVEPTYYFDRSNNEFLKSKFDVPVAAKLSYNLKFIELEISGKYGLINVIKSDLLKSGKIHDLQLSVFFPLK